VRARQAIVVFAVTCGLLGAAACTVPGETTRASALGDDAITIGSFNFPENVLLARIYGQALRADGYHVRFATDIGPRELVEPALTRGLIELLPEYAGTALLFLSLNRATTSANASVNHHALVRQLEATPVAALSAAPAQDSNAFVVRRQTADAYGLRSISDLRPIASRLTFGGPPECPSRPFCVLGLRRTYGLDIKKFLPTDTGGPLTLQALSTGQVDVALLFSTDPRLTGGDLVALRDDRRLQPAENITPLVHRAALRRWGLPLERSIDAVSARLTTEVLRALNREVVIRDRPPSVVAAEWLHGEGIR
jgi:osmoprotectant transport system substrate-binding protein